MTTRVAGLVMALLLSIGAWAQFNPTNPTEPGDPRVKVYSVLTLSADPPEGGTLNVASGRRYEVDTVVELEATPSPYYIFKGWTHDGQLLSMDPHFSYAVEAGNPHLVAHFELDFTPQNPTEPAEPTKPYRRLSLRASPAEGGSFNTVTEGRRFREGARIQLQAYPQEWYSFLYWACDTTILSTESQFVFTMPDADVTLTAHFALHFTPHNPSEPGQPMGVTLVVTDKAAYVPGEPVVISGWLTDRPDSSAVLCIENLGACHYLPIATDAQGAFLVQWHPLPLQTGRFTITLSSVTDRHAGLTMAAFDVYDLQLLGSTDTISRLVVGQPSQGSIVLKNGGLTSLTGIGVELLSLPQGCSLSFEVPDTLAAGQTAVLHYTLLSDEPTTGQEWQSADLRIVTAQRASVPVRLRYSCCSDRPLLVADISALNTTVTAGRPRDYGIALTNAGMGSTGPVVLRLPPFATSLAGDTLAPLCQGDTTMIALRLHPTGLQTEEGQLVVYCEEGQGTAVDLSIRPVQQSDGTLVVSVADELTYYSPQSPLVPGAMVVVSHPFTRAVVVQGLSNTDGLFATQLPEGSYYVSVTAEGHEPHRGSLVVVDPGVQLRHRVDLGLLPDSEAIPKVEVLLPDSIQTDQLAVGQSLIVDVVLENKGPITAQEVSLQLPSNFRQLQFRALDVSHGLVIGPQQRVVVPVRILRTDYEEPWQEPSFARFATTYAWHCGSERRWRNGEGLLRLAPGSQMPPSEEQPGVQPRPRPRLSLACFVPRYVCGDDPRTPDEQEAVVPAEVALMVENVSADDAAELLLLAPSPWVEGSESLPQVVASRQDGSRASHFFSASVPNRLGTVPAGGRTCAQWWLQSGQQGLLSYDAAAYCLKCSGSDSAAVVDRVVLHSLVHGFEVSGQWPLRGFLVDDEDGVVPREVYFTDATWQTLVQPSRLDIIKVGDAEYMLEVEAADSGWVYGSLPTPGDGHLMLQAMSRERDGLALPSDNAWQTDRQPVREGGEWVSEQRLHFVVLMEAGTESFRLAFTQKDDGQQLGLAPVMLPSSSATLRTFDLLGRPSLRGVRGIRIKSGRKSYNY